MLAPVADVATHVTTTGFTANWSSVENAVSYTLQVDRKQPSAGGEILLEEDFDNCSIAGTTNLGGTGSFQDIDDKYFQTPGWSGKYVYTEAGRVKLGNSSNGGALCTPTLDLSSLRRSIYCPVRCLYVRWKQREKCCDKGICRRR